MSNPIMSKNPYLQESRTPAGYPGMDGYQAGGYAQADRPASSTYQQGGYQPFPEQDVRPATQAMTYEDAMMKTGILLLTAIASGAAAWMLLIPANPTAENLSLAMVVAIGASLASLVMGFVMGFKRNIGPGLAIGYSVLQGVALGALTGVLEVMYPGIAVQAVLATLSVVAVCWFLHTSGLVRTTPKGMKIVLTIALAGVIFSLGNLLLSLTGVVQAPWGLRSAEIAGIPLGLILGVVMIIVASYMLINDFETVKIAVANQAPKSFAWAAGVGIVMTILWIYLEILRLIAILRDN